MSEQDQQGRVEVARCPHMYGGVDAVVVGAGRCARRPLVWPNKHDRRARRSVQALRAGKGVAVAAVFRV
eukprot:349912-Chlamydomonas_euryale.AAC.9